MRAESRWWVLTLVVVLALAGISVLALARPTVAWGVAEAHLGTPLCPHCRTQVPFYSRRCPTCREEFSWTSAPDELSPLSPWSLSALEAQYLRDRIAKLGRADALSKTAEALRVDEAAAALYLEQLGRGRCGWCGGSGVEIDAPAGKRMPCAACFGQGACVACGGDRRIRVGDEGSDIAYGRYTAAVDDLAGELPLDVQRSELRRLAEEFLTRHAGTAGASEVIFWRTWTGKENRLALPETVVRAARARLDAVLAALRP